METNLAKCFICNIDCDAKCTNQGLYIAQTLTMPLISVLTKCLRTFVEVESEYFCCECVRKIVDYDNLAKLSLDIETDLYRQYQNKPFRSNFLDDEFIVDQNEIRDKMNDFFDFKQSLKLRNINNTKTTSTGVVDEIDLTISTNDLDEDEDEDDDEEELNETDDIVAVEDLNRVLQNIEAIPVVIDQSESNVHVNEDEEEEFSDAIEENVQSADDQQINSTKKRKIKKVRKRKRNNNNNNNTQSTRVSCDICGRTYLSKGALGTHMVKHSDQNPHGNTIRISLDFTIYSNLNFKFMVLLNFSSNRMCHLQKSLYTASWSTPAYSNPYG